MAMSSSVEEPERKKRSAPVSFLIRLVREKPLGAAGAVIVLILLFAGIFANFIAPYEMNFMAYRQIMSCYKLDY